MKLIGDWIIAEALTLFENHISLHKIAEKLDIPRQTLANIIRWPDKYRTAYHRSLEAKGPTKLILGRTEKCRECGYIVQMPCLVCKTRKYRTLQRLKV